MMKREEDPKENWHIWKRCFRKDQESCEKVGKLKGYYLLGRANKNGFNLAFLFLFKYLIDYRIMFGKTSHEPGKAL